MSSLILKKNNIQSELGGLVVSQVDTYRIVEDLPIAVKDVLKTYAKAYIALPMVWLGPLVIVGIIAAVLMYFDVINPEEPPVALLMTGSGIGFFSFLLLSIRAIRRARGWQRAISNQ